MNSQELADKINDVCLEAQRRVVFQGSAEYSFRHKFIGGGREEVQRFEFESMDDNLQGLEEELLDTINWAAMAILKLREERKRAEADRHPSR